MMIKLVCITLLVLPAVHAKNLNVCATTPELGSLVSSIGGDKVNLTVFVTGTEDPHALVAKPSDIVSLSKADALVLSGLSLEIGWVPALIQRARNRSVKKNGKGYLDASVAIDVINEHAGEQITRAMGDVHPEGNPHYMLDPVSGLKVARYIAESFSKLSPVNARYFKSNLINFEKEWGIKAFGAELVKLYSMDKLVQVQEVGKLSFFLKQTNELHKLKGWFGEMEEIKGVELIADHDQWAYFSKRFNLKIDRAIEPKPGVPPGSRYLKELVTWMNTKKIKGVLATSYFSPRFLKFIEKNSQAEIVEMAHQVGSRVGTNTYLSMIDHNVKQVCACCKPM